jgi:hypothetical protein
MTATFVLSGELGLEVNTWMRWLPVSATQMLPFGLKARPFGPSNRLLPDP